MDVSQELAEAVEGHLSQVSSGRAYIALQGDLLELTNPRAGRDFIYGGSDGALVVLPMHSIRSLTGATPPEVQQFDIAQFLSLQRMPVKISYQAAGKLAAGWLLNVSAPWLRISSSYGIAWIPIAAVELARIDTRLELVPAQSGVGTR